MAVLLFLFRKKAGAVMGAGMTLYCDGGLLSPNPSPVGGTWAWCMVSSRNRLIGKSSGIILPERVKLPQFTNNISELVAAIKALEVCPQGWDGILFTDSYCTWCRVNPQSWTKDKCPKTNGVPSFLVERLRAAMSRLGDYKLVLLFGHPTEEQLEAGKRKDGTPCSPWNVLCDKLCCQQAASFRQSILSV